MIIIGHTDYGELIVSEKGQRYSYFGVYEAELKKVKRAIKRGTGWLALKAYSRTERED